MKLVITVRGNISRDDVALMQKKSAALFGRGTRVEFQQTSRQIDSSVLEIPAMLITMVAGFLYIYAESSRLFGSKLTYEGLMEEIRAAMEREGVRDIEILDVANFKLKSSRDLDEPCIVTLRDSSESGSHYKVFFSNKDNIFVVEIQKS